MCILHVYTLLKVVSYYDLSVLSMSVTGFKKKKYGGWVGGVSSTQVVLDFFLTLQSPLPPCFVLAKMFILVPRFHIF